MLDFPDLTPVALILMQMVQEACQEYENKIILAQRGAFLRTRKAPRWAFQTLSSSISILRSIPEILLCKPRGFLVILRNIDALNLEDDRSHAIVVTGTHHAVVVRPAIHDGTAQ